MGALLEDPHDLPESWSEVRPVELLIFPLIGTPHCDLRRLSEKQAEVEPHAELVLDLSQRLEGQQ
jgi:hypothetical protein